MASEGEFYRAYSIQQATDLLRAHNAVLVSGGQSVMPLLRQGLIDKDVIVDISGLDAHREVEVDEGLVIGGLVTHQELIESGLDETLWAALVETAEQIGDVQVRNWGTVGGAVAHADPSLDYPPTLTVYDAAVTFSDGEATDSVPIDEFYLGQYMTVLEPHEIIVGVSLPTPPPGTGVAFEKYAWRKGDMSIANAAARLSVDDEGAISEARLCVGAMGPTPIRLEELESRLVGEPVDATDARDEVARAVPTYTDPLPETHASVAYKQRLVRNLTRKVLDTAASRALEGR